MDGAVRLQLATGPVSWGVDFADAPGNPPWREVLDGAARAGYRGLELGPLGYLPDGVAEELRARGLILTAGFVFEPLHEPAACRRTLEIAQRTAARVAAAGGRFLVVIDLVCAERGRTAGRGDLAPRLEPDGRRRLAGTVAAIAEIARAHGLRPLVHNHAGSHVEFEDEVEPLLDVVELCLDTGHWAYAGHDPVATYERWAERIPYLHLKDADPARCGTDFWASVRAGAFRPLGTGSVDVPALLAALAQQRFDGWAVVEQDREPGSGDPVDDLVASRRFLEEATWACA
ncbi:MAG: inosose dehydratase [Solirubrobacteraceae bacterium]|jgi:inosose dehydratase|nr:inosose dehydratase [Solirubrobacteraceae bacterium]